MISENNIGTPKIQNAIAFFQYWTSSMAHYNVIALTTYSWWTLIFAIAFVKGSITLFFSFFRFSFLLFINVDNLLLHFAIALKSIK